MAVHVVKNGPRPWGSVIAQGLGQTLSHLAEAKIQKMKTNEDIKLLQSLGVDPLSARFINSLPNDQKREAVGNYLNKQSQQQEQQQQEQQSPMQQILAPQQEQRAQQQQQQPVQQQERPGLGNLFNNGTIGSGINPEFLSRASQAPQKQQQQRQIAAQEQQQIAQQAQQAQQEQQTPAVQQPAGPVAIAPKSKASLLGAALKPASVTAQEVAAERRQEAAARKEEFARENISRKEQFEREKLARAETKKYVETLKEQEKAAKESELRLKRMETLISKGKLPNAGLWSFLTKVEESPIAGAGAGAILGSALLPGLGTAIGAGIGGLAGSLTSPLAGAAKSFIRTGSPDIEEFEKLSADFVKNAKQYFGSRLTDADLRVFMQTLPTLMQTDAGKKKVIENLSSLNELAQIESKAARSIIRDNGGIPPIDIEQQVKDKIADRVDRVAKRFIGQ